MRMFSSGIIAALVLGGLTLAQDTTQAPPEGTPAQEQQNPAPPRATQSLPSPADTAQANPAPRVAPGSVIPVTLTKTVDAKKAKTGDEVDARVTQDMKTGSGEVIVPKDTKVVGHVIRTQARSKEQKESQVVIAFDHVVMNGGEVPTPEVPQAPESKASWPWIELAKVLALPLVTLVLGYWFNSSLNERQQVESNIRLYAEMMGRREEADSNLRKDMFNSILNTFMARDPTQRQTSEELIRQQILSLELLAYNFHESLDIAPLFRDVVRETDRAAVIDQVTPLSVLVARSVDQPRFSMMVLATFAAVALLLASVGLYGVVSYSVAQRRRELGIRAAIGARKVDLVFLVLREGLRATVLGIGIGLLISMGVTRFMGAILFGVTPLDGVAFASGPLVLIGVATLACALPALRAASTDPALALRAE